MTVSLCTNLTTVKCSINNVIYTQRVADCDTVFQSSTWLLCRFLQMYYKAVFACRSNIALHLRMCNLTQLGNFAGSFYCVYLLDQKSTTCTLIRRGGTWEAIKHIFYIQHSLIGQCNFIRKFLKLRISWSSLTINKWVRSK